VRGYDLKHLFEFDLVESSYLFDEEGFMTDPQKSNLCKELETSLKPDDNIHPSAWPECKTTYLVDVMACIRRVTAKIHKTFGDFIGKGFFDMVLRLCIGASRIDFVFDTYVDGSVKDSERSRRCTTQAIEILNLNEETLLPIDMNTF
jgi:hypothetical protein